MKKTHKEVDGQLRQMNKKFDHLKMQQREKIAEWLYQEYKTYVEKNNRLPQKQDDYAIIDNVVLKIEEAGIWIPVGEVVGYYKGKKLRFYKRVQKELNIKLK